MFSHLIKKERLYSTVISSIMIAMIALIITPAVYISSTEENVNSTMVAVVTYNTYKVTNGQATNIVTDNIFTYDSDDESSEKFTSDMTITLDSKSHIVLKYEVKNKTIDNDIVCRIDFTNVNIYNCIISSKVNNDEYKPTALSGFIYEVKAGEILEIFVKIEINDFAINSIFNGKLAFIFDIG